MSKNKKVNEQRKMQERKEVVDSQPGEFISMDPNKRKHIDKLLKKREHKENLGKK